MADGSQRDRESNKRGQDVPQEVEGHSKYSATAAAAADNDINNVQFSKSVALLSGTC